MNDVSGPSEFLLYPVNIKKRTDSNGQTKSLIQYTFVLLFLLLTGTPHPSVNAKFILRSFTK